MKMLSDSETILLRILWKNEKPMSIFQLLEELSEKNINWAYTTVGTFLKRMGEKGFVSSTKIGRTYYYKAEVSEGDVTTGPVKYIDKYFKGSLNDFLSAFTKERQLTEEEINDLKELTERLDKRNK